MSTLGLTPAASSWHTQYECYLGASIVLWVDIPLRCSPLLAMVLFIGGDAQVYQPGRKCEQAGRQSEEFFAVGIMRKYLLPGLKVNYRPTNGNLLLRCAVSYSLQVC